VIIQCDDVLASESSWWFKAPDHNDSWTSSPCREFVLLKKMIIQSNEQEVKNIDFFASFCRTFGLERRRAVGSERHDIDFSIGRACQYASRIYHYCIDEMNRIEYELAPNIHSRKDIQVTITQVMRVCVITRTRILSCIPTLLEFPSLVAIDLLYLKFNNDLISLCEILTRMLYFIRRFDSSE
jgi:hypothetical protein